MNLTFYTIIYISSMTIYTTITIQSKKTVLTYEVGNTISSRALYFLMAFVSAQIHHCTAGLSSHPSWLVP